MSSGPPNDTKRHAAAPASRAAVYRYFFYGWLFRDAQRGSPLERAAALRHNRERARWLPTYLRRWLVMGLLLGGFEAWSERAYGSPLVSATLAVAMVGVIVFLVVTALCWTVLRRPAPG
jgi:di/tricarboxylate transporter